jgi:serine/threonine protein kinase
MIGKTLSHFKVLEEIGEGGMGAVYMAEDLNLGRKVALKILREEMASNPDRLERFRREAQAVAALNHPNIVTIHSIEEAPEGHFISMELVQGKGLDEIVTGDGLSSERILEIAQPLIRALVAAHWGSSYAGSDTDWDRRGHDSLHVSRAGTRQTRRSSNGHLLLGSDSL